MNKTEIKNEINELKKRIAELETRLEEKKVKKGKIWKPEESEEYYYLNGCGYTRDIYTESEIDLIEVANGNCYSTKEKAEFEANREKYTRLFRQYVEQHSEPLDWKDDEQEKYSVYYNYSIKKLEFGYYYSYRDVSTIFASSIEVLKEAIDYVGEDNIKKYILEIKE